jgi:hypothetical protein
MIIKEGMTVRKQKANAENIMWKNGNNKICDNCLNKCKQNKYVKVVKCPRRKKKVQDGD